MIGPFNPLAAGPYFIPGFQVLASNVGAQYKIGGVTVDFSGVTAETVSRTLTGGYVTTVGEKVIEGGSTLYKNGSGDYVPAIDTTTLARGECFVLDKHVSAGGQTKGVIGCVFAVGTVFKARLKVGGAGQPTLSNFLAAFPGIVPQNDA